MNNVNIKVQACLEKKNPKLTVKNRKASEFGG